MSSITKLITLEKEKVMCIFSVPDCHPRYTTCHWKCEHSSNSGQNECCNQNEPEPRIASTSHLHPAKQKKLESEKNNITISLSQRHKEKAVKQSNKYF